MTYATIFVKLEAGRIELWKHPLLNSRSALRGRPYDPHRFLHHLTRKDLSRERGQRAPEDPSFYRGLAEAVASVGAIVVIGHGAGHSNAADGLVEFLRLHHPGTFETVTCEVVADLSGLTPPQLLVLRRRAPSSLSGQIAVAQ